MSVTFRFRGEFSRFAGRDSVILEIPGSGPFTLEAAITHLLSQVSIAGEGGAHAHASIRSAAFFCDGRLLRLQDQIPDGCMIHILSPLAGG